MISGEKILVTGVSGTVAGPLARYLAPDNDVWGIARFADPTPPPGARGQRASRPTPSTWATVTSAACPTTSRTCSTSPGPVPT